MDTIIKVCVEIPGIAHVDLKHEFETLEWFGIDKKGVLDDLLTGVVMGEASSAFELTCESSVPDHIDNVFFEGGSPDDIGYEEALECCTRVLNGLAPLVFNAYYPLTKTVNSRTIKHFHVVDVKHNTVLLEIENKE